MRVQRRRGFVSPERKTFRTTHHLLADPVHALLEEFKVLVSLYGAHFYHSLGGLCVSDRGYVLGYWGPGWELLSYQNPSILEASNSRWLLVYGRKRKRGG